MRELFEIKTVDFSIYLMIFFLQIPFKKAATIYLDTTL